MKVNFDSSQPIYIQLKKQILYFIFSGTYPAGSKLPSVLNMANIFAVAPSTLLKAIYDLERDGLIYKRRKGGRFVMEDIKMIEHLKTTLVNKQIDQFLKKMVSIGFSVEETWRLINKRS